MAATINNGDVVVKIFRNISMLIVLWSGLGHAADEHPAQVLVADNTAKVLDILTENSERIKTDEAFLQETIDTYITPNLDFVAMTKLAIGKNWKKASKAQRKALVEQFHLLLLNTYSNALTQYSGQKINFLPFRAGKREDRAEVRSEFQQTGGAAISVNYKLRKKDAWLIYDISIDGISLVTNYRTGFTSKINSEGIDGLIAELVQKNEGSG